MSYADLTVRDPNFFKRFLQKRRFSEALEISGLTDTDRIWRVLDYGTGDGELIRQMGGYASVMPWGYEPNPALIAEAKQNLHDLKRVALVQETNYLESAFFDLVFCLEVFEHLPEKQTSAAVAEIHRLLKPGSRAVIGVPHELFLPALIKGAFRMSRRYGEFDAKPRNILSVFAGRPPRPRPVSEISVGLPYHFHHLGFDYRELGQTLRKRFSVERIRFSPFPSLGSVLNPEVYFVVRKDRL